MSLPHPRTTECCRSSQALQNALQEVKQPQKKTSAVGSTPRTPVRCLTGCDECDHRSLKQFYPERRSTHRRTPRNSWQLCGQLSTQVFSDTTPSAAVRVFALGFFARVCCEHVVSEKKRNTGSSTPWRRILKTGVKPLQLSSRAWPSCGSCSTDSNINSSQSCV